jgi:ribosome-binding protein aMBF1 (putative translation factor)
MSRQRIAQRLTPRIAICRIAIERARGQCEHCGLHVGRSGWIYHKTSRVMTCDEYNDLNNLAVLCPPCQRRARRRRSEGVPPRSRIVVPGKTATIRLGEQILRRRQEQHLTRKQLAARVHTSHGNLAKIERGGRLAGRALLARIARVLRCSATDLVADWAARGGQRRADGIKSGAGFRHENQAD